MNEDRTVILTEEAFDRIQEFAQFVGVSIERAASRAIISWMATTGDDMVAFIDYQRKERPCVPKLAVVRRTNRT